MRTSLAILLTIGIFAGCSLFSALIPLNPFVLVVVGTSVWAGIDSAMHQLRKYQSGISYGPVALGPLCAMFWMVGFPWYLSMRYKIRRGEARLRPEFEPWEMADGKISPRGLVQPWQGRRL
jgi:hypothetical protein